MSKPIIISIEGNIGSGKSTILEKLQDFMKDNNRIVFLKEPVDIWETIKDTNTGENILQKFYKNQDKYAFPFQVMAYASRLSMIRNTIKNSTDIDIIICERSLAADKHIFAKMLYDDGKIEDVEYQIYGKWFDCFVCEFQIEQIIFMDTTPEICHFRISKRARLGENIIPLEYLDNCHKYHKDMFAKEMKCPIVRLEGNIDTEKDPTQIIKKNKLWFDVKFK
jgi:deoxyadenosine/deoxycytidine kinase